MKTIIAGSRRGFSYEEVVKAMKACGWKPTEVVSGHADGVDTYGEKWAKMRKISLKIIYPDYDLMGRTLKENIAEKSTQYAEALVALWDGESPGTKDMIKQARERGLKVFIWSKQTEMMLER